MPWDGTELRVASLVDGVATGVRTAMGGADESVVQPEWGYDGQLYAVSDRSGWWNLYEVDIDAGSHRALCPREEEFAFPMWLLGFRSYDVLADGRLAVIHGSGSYALGVLDPAITVVEVDVDSGRLERVRAAAEGVPDPAYLPDCRSEALPGPGGRAVHAQVWAPKNDDCIAPDGERPPYVVFVHGGPTGEAPAELDLKIAYFTSRGIGVVDVNYGGPSGYGRAYRNLLRGQWGVVDVTDCVAAAQALVDRGDADPGRIAIRGGSAGGWTTLAALTDTDFFAAGTSFFGVAELLRFAEDTHDFESRYLDALVGPLPEAHDVYVERAPLSKVDQLSCPVLLLQGADDQVVPRSQALMFRDALARKGIPHAYLEFEGEQHGWRKESTIIAAYEAELSFYGQVLGFTPPDVPVLELTTAR